MTNAEYLIKHGIKFADIYAKWQGYSAKTKIADYKIVTTRKDEIGVISTDGSDGADYALKKWLDMKHEEHILDDVERKYLKAVIRPWRGNARKIEYIMKREGIVTGRIIIRTYYGNMEFPSFDTGTMYRGMENGRQYSLEELGL